MQRGPRFKYDIAICMMGGETFMLQLDLLGAYGIAVDESEGGTPTQGLSFPNYSPTPNQ